MAWYFAKLALLLPVLAALIWGSMWLVKRLGTRLNPGQRSNGVRLIETMMVSPGVRLAVIKFHSREILVASSRQGLVRLAETDAREDFVVPDHG